MALGIASANPLAQRARGGRPLYRIFSTDAHSYLYDTATNQLLTIPEDFARYLEKGEFSAEELEELAADGHGGVLLPTSALPLSPGPSLREVERAVRNGCRQVILEISRDCNMRCRYCVYSGRLGARRAPSKQTMSRETALRAVDYLESHSSECPAVAVGFFGGEPLLAPSLIQQVVDHARQVLKDRKLVFSITTNGTLLTREIMAFFAAHDFACLVSLDGPREMNDRNRVFAGSGNGSFDVVMSRVREFQQLYPDYCRTRLRLAMVAVPGTDYAYLTQWLRANDLAAVSAGPAVDDSGEYERRYREQPLTGVEQLRAEYIEAACEGALAERRQDPDFSMHSAFFSPTMRLLRKRPVPTSPQDRVIRRGMCIPSNDRLFVDCTGQLYPCEKTDGRRHLHLGHIDTGVDARKAYDLLVKFHEFLAQECASCWLWRLCRVCAPGPTVGNGYDKDAARRMCDDHRTTMTDMLKMYCTILERNPSGLDCFLEDGSEMGGFS